jgi:hypothetical protein
MCSTRVCCGTLAHERTQAPVASQWPDEVRLNRSHVRPFQPSRNWLQGTPATGWPHAATSVLSTHTFATESDSDKAAFCWHAFALRHSTDGHVCATVVTTPPLRASTST